MHTHICKLPDCWILKWYQYDELIYDFWFKFYFKHIFFSNPVSRSVDQVGWLATAHIIKIIAKILTLSINKKMHLTNIDCKLDVHSQDSHIIFWTAESLHCHSYLITISLYSIIYNQTIGMLIIFVIYLLPM